MTGIRQWCITFYAFLLPLLVISESPTVTPGISFCANRTVPQFSGRIPELPDLNFQTYTVNIEANIVQKQKSIYVTEYYDYKNNKGAIRSTKNKETIWSIINYKDIERYIIYPNKTCVTKKLTENSNVFNFTVGKAGGHIGKVTDALRFGKSMGETFVSDNETVRGIPANHWTSCMHIDDMKATFTLDYYFSKPSYSYATTTDSIPLRAVLKGFSSNVQNGVQISTGTHDFYHIYEFTSFNPGPIEDPQVFEIPLGVVCPGRKNNKPFPRLPEQFTMEYEVIDEKQRKVSVGKLFTDSSFNLTRFDGPPNKNYSALYGTAPITIITDYTNQLEYIIDQVEGNCSKRQIIKRPTDSNRQKLNMEDVLSKWSKMKYTYEGERTFRGLMVDVFANKNGNNIQEIYFLKADWSPPFDRNRHIPTQDSEPTPKPVSGKPKIDLVGMYFTNEAREWEFYVNVYDFIPHHPDYNVFDVNKCYWWFKTELDLEFLIKGLYYQDVYGHQYEFRTALRTAIAKAANILPLRISNLQLKRSKDRDHIVTRFTFLSRPSINIIGNFWQTIQETKNSEAFDNLEKAVKKGLSFRVVTRSGLKMYQIAEESVKKMTIAAPDSKPTHYGPGSMAGLAIGMLIIGVIAGLLGAVFIHKYASRSIPYKIQD